MSLQLSAVAVTPLGTEGGVPSPPSVVEVVELEVVVVETEVVVVVAQAGVRALSQALRLESLPA